MRVIDFSGTLRTLLTRVGLEWPVARIQVAPGRLGAPPELLSESGRDGLVRAVFSVRAYQRKPDGAQVLELAANFERRPVGLTILLDSAWFAGGTAEDLRQPALHGRVTLKSPGASGNNFVHSLARIYRAERMPRHMKAAVIFSAGVLSGQPEKLTAEPVSFKLFHDTGRVDGFTELRLHLDLPAHRAHLEEVNQDFRGPTITSLSE